MQRRDLLVLAGGSMTVAVAGCMGDDGDDGSNDGDNNETEQDNEDDEDEQLTPATFDVSSVSLTETTVAVGASVELTAQVTNSGEQSGSKTVELQQAGEVLASQDVELDAGEQTTVTFTPTTDLELGEYDFTVLTEDGDGTTTLTLAEGEFVVENLDPATAEIRQGEPLTVGADVLNQGPVEDTKSVELRLDGQTVLEKERTLGAEGQQFVEFAGVETGELPIEIGELPAEIEHSIWTPNDEAPGTLSLLPAEPGTLDLSVVDGEGVSLGGVSVTGDGIDGTTDENGVFQRELEPGEYELTISNGNLEVTETVTIEAGTTASPTVELVASTTSAITAFDGTNTSGFTAFDEDNESDARENGISFPEGDVILDGNVSDGQWESTNIVFGKLTVSGLSVQVDAPDGLSGTFDTENELMTVEGLLEVTIAGEESFSYEIAGTTETSGALTGSADFGEDSGTATVVDNEFTVNDTTDDAFLNGQLGLPIEESGRAWLELSYDFTFERS